MGLHSAIKTIAADNTPEPLITVATLPTGAKHGRAAAVYLTAGAANAAAGVWAGGVEVSRDSEIGNPILPGLYLPYTDGSGRAGLDVTRVYVSGTIGDKIHFTWQGA